MKNSVSTLLAALGLLALAPWTHAQGDPARGEQLSQVCAACHGADGNSATNAFPKIAGLGAKYAYKQLVDIKTGRRVVPEMTGILANTSEQDMADLAAYYDTQPLQLTGARSIEVQVHTGEQVEGLELGQRLYRAGNAANGVPSCSGCHSPRGLGNEPAGVPRLSGQYPEYTEKQLRQFRAGQRVNDGDTQVMRSIAAQMSDAEITAVANYIAGLN